MLVASYQRLFSGALGLGVVVLAVLLSVVGECGLDYGSQKVWLIAWQFCSCVM